MKLLILSVGILVVVFLYYAARFVRAAAHFQRRHGEDSEETKRHLKNIAALASRDSNADAKSPPDKAAKPDATSRPGRGPGESGLATDANTAQIAQLEVRMLRLLCRLEQPSPRRRTLLDSLRAYRFCDLNRQLIYETIRELPPAPAGELARELASELTRRGFPDADLNPFFESLGADCADDGDELLQRLLASESPNGGSQKTT